MVDISDLLDCKPEWKQCKKCNAWLSSEESLIRHYEFSHMSYTPFDEPQRLKEKWDLSK